MWAYALMMTLCLISANESAINLYLLIACIIFEIFIEILQYFKIISGTFDFGDIIYEILMNLLAIAIWKYTVKGKTR